MSFLTALVVLISATSLSGFDSELRDRILTGDTAALDSVASFSQEEQAKLYYSCLFSLVRQPILREKNPKLIPKIVDRFVKLEDHANYLRKQIERHTVGSGRKREAVFEVASKLPSEEVKKLLMEFVFDERILDSHDSLLMEVFSPTNSSLAAWALGEMKLPDSPLPAKNPLFYNQDDEKKWQEWAKEQQIQGRQDVNTVGFSPPQAGDGLRSTPGEALPLRPVVEVITKPISLRWPLLIGVIALLAVVIILLQRNRT